MAADLPVYPRGLRNHENNRLDYSINHDQDIDSWVVRCIVWNHIFRLRSFTRMEPTSQPALKNVEVIWCDPLPNRSRKTESGEGLVGLNAGLDTTGIPLDNNFVRRGGD